MRTELKYTFSGNDDGSDFYMITKASEMYFTLWDFDDYLRSALKYPDDKDKKIDIDTLEIVREKLHEFMDEHDVDFEHVC